MEQRIMTTAQLASFRAFLQEEDQTPAESADLLGRDSTFPHSIVSIS